MAKKKKPKWPYKYVSPGKFDELKGLSDKELMDQMLRFDTNVKGEKANKKNSAVIKENGELIRKHRKQYEESSEDFNKAKDEFEVQKQLRDSEVAEFIEEKSDMEKGFNDAIKNFQEHREVCIKLLKDRK